MKIKLAFAGTLMAATLMAAVPTRAQTGNPFEADTDAIRAGAALYGSRCADCHGADAKGVRGPDLTVLWASGASDLRVFESIRSGREGSIMPPSTAPDDELWAIVAYLRNISTVPPFESGRGNAVRGRELFVMHCSECHRVGREGGALGPDLSHIGAVRSREALTLAISDPSASVAPGFRTIALTLKSGETIRGVVKSEDVFSVQVMDTQGRLQGFTKAGLASFMHEARSLMPELWPGKLNNRRLDDVLAYLGTLRGEDEGNE